MAISDWLPLVTSVGGTAVGLGGIFATLRSGKRQQETALAVARHQADHQARLSREERKQRRWEDSYSELVSWLTECMQLRGEVLKHFIPGKINVEAIRDFMISVGAKRPTGMAPLLWSTDVSGALDDFDAAWERVARALHGKGLHQERHLLASRVETINELQEALQHMRTMTDDVLREARADLNHGYGE